MTAMRAAPPPEPVITEINIEARRDMPEEVLDGKR
jgi:hypothetical protein